MKGYLQSKMKSRYGGRVVGRLAVLLTFLASSCAHWKSPETFPLPDKASRKVGFSYKYLAGLVNQPVQSERETSFVVQKATAIHIFGTAELDIDLVSVPQRYLFKSDDIELFFQTGPDKSRSDKAFLYSVNDFEDPIDTTINEANFYGHYDPQLRMYLINVKIPWSTLQLKDIRAGRKIAFNTAIGDNDDKTKQKSKLVWMGASDPLYQQKKQFGTLILSNPSSGSKPEMFVLSSVKLRDEKEPDWSQIPAAEITNIAFGAINDTQDFSGRFRSCWTDAHLFLRFEVNDSQPKIAVANLKGSTRFHDFGSLSGPDGKDIWKMTVDNSSHAGGAAKNRKIDTVLHLKAGNYKLKYVTDESHSWDNWDDRPPNTGYYGIQLYELVKK